MGVAGELLDYLYGYWQACCMDTCVLDVFVFLVKLVGHVEYTGLYMYLTRWFEFM